MHFRAVFQRPLTTMDQPQSDDIKVKTEMTSEPQKNTYVCPVCKKCIQTSNIYLLKSHQQTHSDKVTISVPKLPLISIAHTESAVIRGKTEISSDP